jgi:hypothetical protein
MAAKKAKKATEKKSEKKTTAPKAPKVLYHSKLTDKELRILGALNGRGKGTRKPLSIAEISELTWKKSMGSTKSNWTVRNAVRRPLRLFCVGLTTNWIERVEVGVYRITALGRNQMKKPTPMPEKVKKTKASTKPAKKVATKKVATKKVATKKVATKKPTKRAAKAPKEAKNSKPTSIIPVVVNTSGRPSAVAQA